ncbi:metallophosphoesterase family protein [Agromyces bauzanensis]|uniref:Calcineurin-like phosphoesterase domain-containing protein n=1 Tax=Agromyces bauzanensis TaxID=1308924 RepID=A0A917UP49_9MICO|nr:hypothetical protein GCM10011372_07870 [Agromyces bauzanensis]
MLERNHAPILPEHRWTTGTRLLLISDTHIPARAMRLLDAVWRAVDEADVVIHAGDWTDVATLDALEAVDVASRWMTRAGVRLRQEIAGRRQVRAVPMSAGPARMGR